MTKFKDLADFTKNATQEDWDGIARDANDKQRETMDLPKFNRMTEKLKLIIEKAERGGWSPLLYSEFPHVSAEELSIDLMDENSVYPKKYRMLIFQHDFAKAYFGTERVPSLIMEIALLPEGAQMWQYHLQIMVLKKDPIKYLAQFLDD